MADGDPLFPAEAPDRHRQHRIGRQIDAGGHLRCDLVGNGRVGAGQAHDDAQAVVPAVFSPPRRHVGLGRVFHLADDVRQPFEGPALSRWKRQVRVVGQGQALALIEGNQQWKAMFVKLTIERFGEVARQQFGVATLPNHVGVPVDNRLKQSQETATGRTAFMPTWGKAGCRTCVQPLRQGRKAFPGQRHVNLTRVATFAAIAGVWKFRRTIPTMRL